MLNRLPEAVPIAAIVVVVLILRAAIIGLMICAFSMDTANSPAQVLLWYPSPPW